MMEFETGWLLLIPAFFMVGWIAARVDIKQLLSEANHLPHGYFKGLNLLLNDQHDKAIDTFIDVLKLNPETIELHFALGNLFRRRGEIERAIRIHQNLLARPDLAEDLQMQARFELGIDYLKAGLLDRSEESFQALLHSHYDLPARRALLDIYQREKEWERAIKAALALQEAGSGTKQKEIAQFYCELAQDNMVSTCFIEGLHFLDEAHKIDRNNVRATILRGDIYLAQNKPELALDTWRRVEQQNMPYVALVAARIMRVYESLQRPHEGINLINHYLEQIPSIDLLEVLCQASLAIEDHEITLERLLTEIKRAPTLLGLDKLLEVRTLCVTAEKLQELTMVKNLIHSYAIKMAHYQCAHCGFKTRQFYWQCPGCNQWESYLPRRTEELNLTH